MKSPAEPLPRFAGLDDVFAVEQQPIETFMTGTTVPEVMAAAARSFGSDLAYTFYADADLKAPAREFTFDALHRNIRAAAAMFRSLGIDRRDVVACLLPGLPETMEITWGATEAGIAMPINPYLEAGIIAAMLMHVDARVLCIEGPSGTEGTFDKLAAIRELAPCIENVVIVGEPEPSHDGISYNAARDTFLDIDHSQADLPHSSDIAAYFHTGGTTGAPKIAPLTHYNLAAMAFIAAYGAGIRSGDGMPCGMPLFHVGGLVMGSLAPFAHGARIIQLTRRGYRQPGLLGSFWEFVARERAAILVGPPTVVVAAMQRFRDDLEYPDLRSWISSAAALPAEAHRRFVARTGIPIKEAWGLTEAALVLTFTPADGAGKPGAVGVRMPFCEVEIAKLSSHDTVARLLPAGEAGVIVARSPSVFPGYLDAATNRGVLLGDGWLNTGDIGFFDADGYLVISGRAKDVIIRGGHNIDPKTIEDALMAHPDVALAAAVGRPDRRVGEVPIAFVALRPGATPDASEILEAAKTAIDERAATPKEIVILPALPLTGVGKVHKPTLRLEACRRAVAELLDLPLGTVSASEVASGRRQISLTDTSLANDHTRALLGELDLDLAECSTVEGLPHQ